jgi:hypothetical protein
MRIQYAIFCQEADLGPPIRLLSPVSAVFAPELPARIDLKLFITLLGGRDGEYTLGVIVKNSRGTATPIKRFSSKWNHDFEHGKAGVLTLPVDIDAYGVYTFTLLVNGEPQREVVLPVSKD